MLSGVEFRILCVLFFDLWFIIGVVWCFLWFGIGKENCVMVKVC